MDRDGSSSSDGSEREPADTPRLLRIRGRGSATEGRLLATIATLQTQQQQQGEQLAALLEAQQQSTTKVTQLGRYNTNTDGDPR